MRQPQQQHAIERQQQYWVPVCEGDSEGSGQECPRSGDGQSTRVQGLPWRPARKPTGGSLFSARRARGTNTNGGPGLVVAASAAGNVPALSSVMGADGHEIEVVLLAKPVRKRYVWPLSGAPTFLSAGSCGDASGGAPTFLSAGLCGDAWAIREPADKNVGAPVISDASGGATFLSASSLAAHAHPKRRQECQRSFVGL